VTLHVGKGHDGDQGADMQARGSGIETDITGNLMAIEKLADRFIIRRLLNEAPLHKHIIDIFHLSIPPYNPIFI
jgi:hypothetical protein